MVQRVIQGNPRSKRPLGRSRIRWDDGIRKDFLNARGGDYGDMDWKEAVKNIKEWGRICSMV